MERRGSKEAINSFMLKAIMPIVAIAVNVILGISSLSQAQETLNIPSYYGGTNTTQQPTPPSNQLQTQQTYQNLVNNLQINQSLMSQLAESSEVVANPNTGEMRTVGSNDPTPSGWMRLNVTPTANGYTIANNGSNSSSGQFSYTIQQQPVQYQPGQTQTPNLTYNNSTPSQTTTNLTGGGVSTTTNNTQTTVGNTNVEIQDDGTKITTTPTETVDTSVTTITTPDSETIITEITTTTLIEGTIETPTTIVTGGNTQPPVVPTGTNIATTNVTNSPDIVNSAPSTPTNTAPIVAPSSPTVASPVLYEGTSNVPIDTNGTPAVPSGIPIPYPNVTDAPAGTTNVSVENETVAVTDSTISSTDNSETDTTELTDDTNTSITSGEDNIEANSESEEVDDSGETAVSDEAIDTDSTEGSEEGTETPETATPASIMANNTMASQSGPSQAEREAAAARAAEEERRRREEYIKRQEEASSYRAESQNRAMQLLEDDNPAVMGGMNGEMGGMNSGMSGTTDMADPQRMSIYNQNMRIQAGNNTPDVSGQIASLSNAIASINNDDENDSIPIGAIPCPPILANACAEAADRAADQIEEEAEKKRKEARDAAEDELDETDQDLEENEERADDEKKRRDRRTDRQKRRDRLEEEQRQRAEDLNEEGDELEKRGTEQQERRARLEQEERDLRKQEQDARRNGDPNCRGAECRSIREQRQQNSRDTTDLAREEGRFQADQARFQGRVQDYQRREAQLDELRQGDPVYESQRMRADAHQAANDAQSEVDRLKEEQLNLRRQGGSGSRQDRAYDQAIERAERQAQAAANNAALADRTALQAEFYANGMQDEWKEYENARKASDAFNNFVDASNNAADLRSRLSSAYGALDGARNNPDFDPESLKSLEEEVTSLRNQLDTAQNSVRQYSEDIGNTTENLTGNRMGATNETSRLLTQTLNDISNEFSERQRLSNLSDAELANEMNMIGEARERVAAAKNGLGGEVQDPGGPYTQRYNELETRRAELQNQIDNFNPGGNGPGIVFGADEAYRQMQSELTQIEGELSGMGSIAAANSAIDRVASHNDWSEGLLEGFPLDQNGNIDRATFQNQVSEMAQAQMNLVEANGNLENAKNNLTQAEANGNTASIERAQSQISQFSEDIDRITNQFELNNVNVEVNENGDFNIEALNNGASVTWAAAAEGVSEFAANAATAKQQLASARGGSVPDASTEVENNNSTSSNENAGTNQRIVEVIGPVVNYEPPLEAPGGYFVEVVETAEGLAEQATRGAAIAVAGTTKPESIADYREIADNAKQTARQRSQEASRVDREIEDAKREVEIAENEAEFRRSQADGITETRERQADEYVDFAENATERAEKKNAKAAELDEQATRLRADAERNIGLANSTDDKSLARDATTAANNNIADAEAREAEAERMRAEAAREAENARSLTARENEIRDEAKDTETRAREAEEELEKAKADLARLENESTRLHAEAEKLDIEATTRANDLAETQRKAFNDLINNPPEGWRWSSLESDERSTWLRENIPQWNDLNTDQRIEFLQKLELGEAANDFKAEHARYEEFNESSQGQRSTPEMLESRQRDLVGLQTRLKELDDMTFLSDEEKAEQTRLKEGLEVGTARLRSDQRARATAEQMHFNSWQEANKKLWAVNDEARAEEVQRHVDTYASAQAQVDMAKSIQTARSEAFDTREAEINSRIQNPTSAADAEAARGELTRLKEARTYWAEFDASNLRGSEAIASEIKSDITYYGTMNGLGEIGFEDNLEERTRTKLNADEALQTRQQNLAQSIQTSVSGIDFKEEDPNIWQSIITGYDATTGAIQDTAVTISSGVGAVYGTGKGIVTGLAGLVDIVVIQSLDTYYETLELYAEELTGTEIDIFGSENLDTINSMGESSWGDLGIKFVVMEGKKIATGLDRLESAYQTGSLTDAFTGTSEVTAVGAELFVDPTLVIGGAGKVISVLRAVDKVDELAQAANVVDDVLRAADTLGDVSRAGDIVTDATRVTDAVGDSVRFADNAHLPEASGGAYKGFDELMGPEFANAFGTTPRTPVYPPPRPAPLKPGANAGTSTPLPPRDSPFQGLDELLGPEFANAFDDVPRTPFDPNTSPYQGLDELLGPEYANAFGTTPNAPVYPPVRPSPLRPGVGTTTTSLPPRDGPFIGFDELMGPEFANAFDDVPVIPHEPGGGPYQGLDELLGPEFANAFGEVPKTPVYPPARPAPLSTGVPTTPSTPLPPRDGPFIGLDEMLGPEFRNAFDDPLVAGRSGPGGTAPNAGGIGGGQGPIPPTNSGGAIPPTGGSIPPTNPSGAIPPTNASGARPTPSASNSNAPLIAGEANSVGPISGTDVGQLPPGVLRTTDGLIQANPAPIVTARQAGDFIVIEEASGARHILEVGDEVGRGSFTVVNELRGTNRGNVIKTSKQVDPITARLDNVGTQAISDLPKGVRDNFVYTPELRGEFQVAAANDNAALAGKSIRIAEQAPVPTYSQARGPSTPMTQAEVNSISRAQDLVNEGGHVILDLKSNNFGFQDLNNGLKRVVVHDAGGTVPTIGATATEKAANAKTIQRALMSPDEALVTQFNQAMDAYNAYKIDWARAKGAGDTAAMAIAQGNANRAAARAFDITSGHGRAVLAEYGHLIDTGKLGITLDQIGFNPVLGFNQEGVRATARAAAANDNFLGFGLAADGF